MAVIMKLWLGYKFIKFHDLDVKFCVQNLTYFPFTRFIHTFYFVFFVSSAIILQTLFCIFYLTFNNFTDPSTTQGAGSPKSFSCRLCPYKTSRRSAYKQHLSRHTPRADCIFKCMACPFYVNSKTWVCTALNPGLSQTVQEKVSQNYGSL
jgi:hypothetical protein